MTGSGGSDPDDPFGWSNERLIKELCTDDRTWTAPAPRKWPDPVHLASMLEEHDLDGQDLLTHEDQMGREGFETLCKDLGIKKIPHKTSLRMAIRSLQERSPAYKAWKKERDVGSADALQTPQKPRPGGSSHAASPLPFHAPKTSLLCIPPHRTATSPDPAMTLTQGDQPNSRRTSFDADVASAMDIDDVDVSQSPAHSPGEAPKKRKRLAPTNVSSSSRSHSGHIVNNIADETAAITYNPLLDTISERTWQNSSRGAYLGHWKLTVDDILQGPDPLAAGASSNDADGYSQIEGFGWAKGAAIPAGRRFQVDRIMRRFLRPKRASLPQLGRYRPEDAAGSGAMGARNGTGALLTSAGEDPDDDVLPALGESDDEGYDTETWEAMEEEACERQNQQKHAQRHLAREAVDRAIADAIRAIETKWAAKKAHKLRRQEHALWQAARRMGSQKFMADTARREVERYAQRVSTLVEEIRHVEWKSEAEIARQATVLEASVEDRQLALWEAKLYSLLSAPPKAANERAARPQLWPGMRTIRTRVVDGDDEILTSSSDEDDPDDGSLGGFVVDDELATSAAGQAIGSDDDDDDDDDDIVDDGLSLMVRPNPILLPPAEQDKKSTPARSPARSPAQSSTRSPEHGAGRAPSSAELPSVLHDEDIWAITSTGPAHYEKTKDVTRLLLALFYDASQEQMVRLFDSLSLDDDAVWQKYCLSTLTPGPKDEADQLMVDDSEPVPEEKPEDDGTLFTRFFCIFLFCRIISPNDFDPTSEDTKKDITDNRGRLGSFCDKMRTIASYFGYGSARDKGKGKEVAAYNNNTHAASPGIESAHNTPASTPDQSMPSPAAEVGPSDAGYVVIESDSNPTSVDDSLDEESDEQVSPSKRRRRIVRRDKEAQDLRDKDKARHENLETRRKALYQNLAQSGTISRDRARLIINLAKEDHHGFVYINPWISFNIRDHQIEGVRFMWNQIVTPSDSRQGCLLAHTMGLGKTMQVITLLVAIAEAAKSPDRSIACQIPDDLRQSKTLILCPSGLVDNWMDELLAWAQDGILGATSQVTSAMDHLTRRSRIQAWARNGGIMVLGYPMFGKLLDDFADFHTLLQETPNIVIADEAHALKNPKSKVHRITSGFRTSARIAMTGSPLANSVEEYHSMINWVAPNYLADHREFVSVYAKPIKEGFYRDSLASQKRHAYKMLKILKDTVAPKIHRATVASLKGELPEKREFILYLPLTDIQLSVYREFMDVLRHHSTLDGITTTLQLWNFMFNVTLLLAHPQVLQTRLDEMRRGFSDANDGYARKASLPAPVVEKLLGALQHAARQAAGSSGPATADASVSDSLNHIAYSSKMTVLSGILDEARRVGDKVLVFSQSRNVLDYLDTELRRQGRKFARLDGGTAVDTRQAMVKEFNAGADEVYLISTTAGGVGLNIHGANRVVIFDFRWNPMHEQQAIGRAFRIGQRKNVYVYWLIVDGTYETLLHDQAVFKTQLASRVVDKKNPSAWADQMRNYTRDPVKVPVNTHLAAEFRGRDAVLDALLADSAASRSQIARIVTTDTFEQEEPEATLTAEELSEAAIMVIMNKQRLKHGSHTGTMATAAAGEAYVAAASSYRTAAAERMQVDSASFAPSAAAHAARGPMPMALATAPSAPWAQQPPVPMQIPTQATTTNVAPAVRAGGAGLVPSQPFPQHARLPLHAALPSAYPTPTPKPNPTPSAAVSRIPSGLMATDSNLRDEMTRRLARGAVATQAKPSMHVAACIADVVVESIKKHFVLSGLPASSQWARLRQGVASDAVFLEAVAYGIADPAVLATMTHKTEARYVAVLHSTIGQLGTSAGAGAAKQPWYMRELFCNHQALRRVLLIKMLEGATPSLPAYQGDFLRSHAKALAVVDCIKKADLAAALPGGPYSKAEAAKELLARFNRIAFRDGICADYLVAVATRLGQRAKSGSPESEAAEVASILIDALQYAILQRGGTPSAQAQAPANAKGRQRQGAPKSERRDSHAVSLLDIPPAASSTAPANRDVSTGHTPHLDPPMLSAISNGFQRARDDFQQSQSQSQPAPSRSGSATPVSRDQLAMSEVIKRRQRKEGRRSGSSTPTQSRAVAVQGSQQQDHQGSPSPVQQALSKTKAQLAREMLEADERQRQYRLQQGNGPSSQSRQKGALKNEARILPPSSKGPGTANDPFVLD